MVLARTVVVVVPLLAISFIFCATSCTRLEELDERTLPGVLWGMYIPRTKFLELIL